MKLTQFLRRRALVALGMAAIAVIFAAPCVMAAAADSGAAQHSFEATLKPALLYVLPEDVHSPSAMATHSDNPFVKSGLEGVAKARMTLGLAVLETRNATLEEIPGAIRKLAEGGYSPIITLGSIYIPAVLELAERFPSTRFIAIDALVPPLYANVQSVLFRDHEGAFLAGIIAGHATQSHKIGFIGGMDNPVIRSYATGFRQGLRYVSKRNTMTEQFLGTGAIAWNEPQKAYSMARMQYDDGVDVIFSPAGASSLGVLRAANDTGKLAIGVDSNQNQLYPGHVLTSLIKRVDVAVYNALVSAKKGQWNPGIKSVGIKEGALDFAVDEFNRSLMTPALIEEVTLVKERIINGVITVEPYTAN